MDKFIRMCQEAGQMQDRWTEKHVGDRVSAKGLNGSFILLPVHMKMSGFYKDHFWLPSMEDLIEIYRPSIANDYSILATLVSYIRVTATDSDMEDRSQEWMLRLYMEERHNLKWNGTTWK